MDTLKLPTSYMAQMGEAGIWLTNRDWLWDQYITQCKSTREIAAQLGCGKKAVATALKRFSIPIRVGVRDKEAHSLKSFTIQARPEVVDKLNNAEWLHHQFITINRSKYEIAAGLGVPNKAVDFWLRKFGIKGTKTRDDILVCAKRRYTELNGFAPGSEQACYKRMRGRSAIQIQTTKAGVIWCHSSWEVATAAYLDQLPQVYSYGKDTIRIRYTYNNRNRCYFPDFLVYLTDGRVLLIEVKPEQLVEYGSNKVKAIAAREFCQRLNWQYIILTGKNKFDPSDLLKFIAEHQT